jgi:hypothetical protein
MLPHADNFPAHPPQFSIYECIAILIPLQFLRLKLPIFLEKIL